MTSPPRKLTVDCPKCHNLYQDWCRSINMDIDNFDDEYLDSAGSAVCPRCGFKVYLGQLIVRDGEFYFDEGAQSGDYVDQRPDHSSEGGDTTGERDHPVEVLFARLPQVEPYPAGVIAVPARIPGVAFFPGGSGLQRAEAGKPLPPMPIGAVMVVGHDVHSETGFHDSLAKGTEVGESPHGGHVHSATWDRLLQLLDSVAIPAVECFFTNAYMGLRKGSESMGRFPGARDPAFVLRCQDFLRLQLAIQRPSLVLTLGIWVPAFMAAISPQLAAWKGIKTYKSLDAAGPVKQGVQFEGLPNPPCTVVTLTHPSLRERNVRRRQYGVVAGHEAEIAMLWSARIGAEW